MPLPRAGNDPNIVKDRALENAALYGLRSNLRIVILANQIKETSRIQS